MMEGAHVINVHDLVNSMTRKLEQGSAGVMINKNNAQFPMIQKIKRLPSNADNDANKTTAVSIGPYHYKTNATLEMEMRKWESFRYILQLNPEKRMRDYLEAMASLEQQIRTCYCDEVKMDSKEFVKMMLLDGCFLLYIHHGIEGALETVPRLEMPNVDDRTMRLEQTVNEAGFGIKVDSTHQQSPINNSEHEDSPDNTYDLEQWSFSFLTHDLIFLENQIPFFVVVKIFELVTNGNIPITVLLRNVSMFMEDVLQPYPKSFLNFDHTREIHHLLHLCHLYFKPNPLHVQINSTLSTSYDDEVRGVISRQQLLGWHRTSEYFKAGVDFRKRETCSGSPHSLLDVSFCNGVMEIPCLTIDPNSYCLFWNLIAFEETCPQFGNYFTSYIVFLSQFITMPEDVSLLTKRGIIVDQLDGGAEVSDLLKMLAQGVTFDFNGENGKTYQMGKPRWREWLGPIGSKFLS